MPGVMSVLNPFDRQDEAVKQNLTDSIGVYRYKKVINSLFYPIHLLMLKICLIY